MDGVRDLYAARGIILKPVDLTDLFLYVAYDGMRQTANDWGMKPGGMAFAKACTRVFDPDGQQYLQQWWTYQSGRKTEEYYRGLFAKTGLLVSRPNDLAAMFEKSSDHISPEIFGEVTPTVGKGLDAEHEGYDGIILIGPFKQVSSTACSLFRGGCSVNSWPTALLRGLLRTRPGGVYLSGFRQPALRIDHALLLTLTG